MVKRTPRSNRTDTLCPYPTTTTKQQTYLRLVKAARQACAVRRGNPAIIIERTMSAQGVSSPMNKNELVEAVAASSGLSKADAGRALAPVVGSINGAMKAGESVNLIGFGPLDGKITRL